MKLSENRPVACCVLALAVAASLFIGGGNALLSQGKSVNAQYSAASESISAELKEIISNATVMNTIVANASDADTAKTEAVTDAIAALEEADSVSSQYDAAQELVTAVEDLYSYATTNLTLSETNAADLRYKYKNYAAALLRISHDSYNESATAFNQEKSGFPASLISTVRGISDAELYE